MRIRVWKLSKSTLLSMALFFIFVFNNNFVSGEETKEGLSIENVRMMYVAKDEMFRVMFTLINIGNKETTVLTENLNTGFLSESKNNICEIGAGITAKYKGYKIIQSLCRFDPVTLRPNEATVINHSVKRKLSDIDKEGGLTLRYKINEDFGARHIAWHGSVEAAPVTPRIIK